MKKFLLGMASLLVLCNTNNVIAQTPATAIFAGGCFWCMEPPFDRLEGVLSTTSGYTGGQTENPSYKEVSAGGTGHTEAIKVEYDPSKITYEDLLAVFWKNIDPTTRDAQFCDHGNQYRSGIYYQDEAQRQAAMASLKAMQQNKPFKEAIVTEIEAASIFYPAEDYHQDYYQKNPVRYKYYRYRCGRDQRLNQLWGEKR
ncbi:MAG: peptide-methionine (S)-S-oxide reductase MsrA [Gammaproteobacteria bacterium]|nr:peptide-methionine (S)-S-oxide reductase MsrA [Gammaproteobacteria bacterium]